MSSVWWLGWRSTLGLARLSKATENILRSGDCVLNLPSDKKADAVNRYEKDKFAVANLTAIKGDLTAAPRTVECQLQMEARVDAVHDIAAIDRFWGGRSVAIEVKIVRVHADESILIPNAPNRIDPDKWRPLIMSLQQFYGLADGKLRHSALGEIPGDAYRPIEARMG